MITNTEIVIASKNTAQEIEDEANKEAESIIEKGKNEANHIINDAEKMSEDRRKGADNYARDLNIIPVTNIDEVLKEALIWSIHT